VRIKRSHWHNPWDIRRNLNRREHSTQNNTFVS
jgi:hypothetical protein